jgi:hypothetical protein
VRGAGYGQIICDDPIVARDRHGRLIDVEHDTFTCAHCSGVVFVNARERAADIGGFCRACGKNICGPCVDKDICRPVEKLLEMIERGLERERTRKSYEG